MGVGKVNCAGHSMVERVAADGERTKVDNCSERSPHPLPFYICMSALGIAGHHA
jgi:hypothetical protein